MKLTRNLGIALIALTLSSAAYGQAYLSNPKYGPDEESRKECAANLSVYSEYYKQKNYVEAKKTWSQVFSKCPAVSKNTFIRGARIVKESYNKASEANKPGLLDTLMLLYDRRIEYFGERGDVLGSKAQDLYTLAPERYEEAYGYSKECLDLLKSKASASDLFFNMTLVNAMFTNQKIDAEAVIEAYSTVSDYLDMQLAAKPDDEKLQSAKANIDATFAKMGVANCSNLVPLFGPRFEANPSDAALCKKIRNLMQANRCTSEPLFLNVSVALFKLEPSASLAYDIAHLYRGVKGYKEMENYYNEAINLEQDSLRRAAYYYELATLTFGEFKKFAQAKALALKAIDLKPNYGEAYRLIGDMYASERNCGGDELARKAVYWAAVDKYAKAKEVDPSMTESMNALISTYSQYFPSKEDLFFHDLKPGDGYSVGCWIGERTTVRERR